MIRLLVAAAITSTVIVTGVESQETRTSPPETQSNVDKMPFGEKFPQLDNDATGEWWKPRGKKKQPARLLVERNQVLAFAVYTHDRGQLKLTAQLYPLYPNESKVVRLEFMKNGAWEKVAERPVVELGWSAHFRIPSWDNTKTVRYRLRHGDDATFEGTIRKDPIGKDEIVVGTLSCNSRRTPGPRPNMIANLKRQDPDFLFFAGDQSYHHTQHTFGWIEFGVQFRDVLKDRPVVTIPDDHDVGQANIWGENGKRATNPAGASGGFFYPAKYVNMVQRCQTWHLPDPVDPAPIERGIGVYFTNLRIGGIDFAIVEDRKFKSGPDGKIPKMGPRPDHINDPSYDRNAIDLDGLVLMGERQLKFLDDWSADWTGAQMKCVLSQTAFCGAVHLHGQPDNRLLADLDCNGWPQTGRKNALVAIRRAWAPHLCGDQHLAVVVKHGIDGHRDGPYGFTSPAIVNTIYGRWWHPENEQAGPHAVNGPLPWTGDYEDGLGNPITMLAYANPTDRTDQTQRADGYGLVRFNKSKRTATFECWPRFADVAEGNQAQFPGWPITINMEDNDGRPAVGWLPEIVAKEGTQPVIQVIDEKTKDVLYTVRASGNRFRPRVYTNSSFEIKVGANRPEKTIASGITPSPKQNAASIHIAL